MVRYESHQNGDAERWQTTISAKARNPLIDADAPDFLRSEAVMCAAYLLNLVPSRGGIDGVCHYQLFHGRKLSIDILNGFSVCRLRFNL